MSATTSRTSPRSASWCGSCAPPSSWPSWAERGGLAVALALLAPLAPLACRKDTPAAEAQNRYCQEAVADGRITEARAWLANPGTVGFEVDKPVMTEVAEAFYAAGAPLVRAAWDELDGRQVSALFVVELPSDAAARTRVFGAYRELALERHEPDVGQVCLLIPFE